MSQSVAARGTPVRHTHTKPTHVDAYAHNNTGDLHNNTGDLHNNSGTFWNGISVL